MCVWGEGHMHMSAGANETRGGHQMPWQLSAWCGYRQPNLGLLEEQYMLLITEPPLQFPQAVFYLLGLKKIRTHLGEAHRD